MVLEPGATVSLGGRTDLASSNYKGNGACSVSTSTKDLVYAVTPPIDGTLNIVLTPDAYDAVLYVRTGACVSGGSQEACSQEAESGNAERVSLVVKKGTTYSVFADGNAGDAGAFKIDFTLSP